MVALQLARKFHLDSCDTRFFADGHFASALHAFALEDGLKMAVYAGLSLTLATSVCFAWNGLPNGFGAKSLGSPFFK